VHFIAQQFEFINMSSPFIKNRTTRHAAWQF